MKEFTLSISSVISDGRACTYHGQIDYDDDYINMDIESGYLPDIDYNDMWSACEYWQPFLDDMPSIIDRNIRPIIEKKFDDWGLKVESFQFWRPREYNFRGDSIDVTISHWGTRPVISYLEKEIKYYIDNVRQKSCSGYISFEPDNFLDVKIDDHAVFWALCKHLDLLGDLEDAVTDIVEEANENLQSKFMDSVYKFAEERDPEFFKKLEQERFMATQPNIFDMITK